MCAAPEEKQGYLGNIEAKSIPELKELLERQQKILNKPRFLLTLPDKGRKVREFVSYLQQLIASIEGKRSLSPQEPTSATLHFKCQSHNGDEVSLTSIMSPSDNPPSDNPPGGSIPSDNPPSDNQSVSSELRLESRFKEQEKNYKISLAARNNTVPHSTFTKTQKSVPKVLNDFSRLRDKHFPTDHILTSQPENIQTTDNGPDVSVVKQRDDESECDMSDAKVIKDRNRSTEDLVQMMSDIDLDSAMEDNSLDQHQEVKQKVLENALDISHCFRPNRTLKITDVCDLPEKYLYKSKGGSKPQPTNQKQMSRVYQDSAATPPSYSYDSSKVISLSDSVNLQKQQQARQLELQAKQAAQRLSERLNVKMDSFSPEGMDITYRTPEQEVVDSDDEPEVEGYNDS